MNMEKKKPAFNETIRNSLMTLFVNLALNLAAIAATVYGIIRQTTI